MAQPLDARIAAALAPDARAATVAELISELTAEIATAQAEHDRLDLLARSATASEDEAEKASEDAGKISRRIVRLNAKKQQLDQRHEELMNSERRKRQEAEDARILAERDQLVEDLIEQWPALTGRLIALLERIEACPMGAAAEALARDCPGNFYRPGPMMRFTQMKIPSLRGAGLDEFAWPRHVNQHAAQEAAQRQAIQLKERARLEAQRWRRYVVTPPGKADGVVSVQTRNGAKSVKRSPVICVMDEECVAGARDLGCVVEPAADNESIGSFSGLPSF